MSFLLLRTGLLSGALLATGCAAAPRDAGFADVRASVDERIGQRVVWNRNSDDDRAAMEAVRELLQGELDADAAVQVALLNNPELQATYEELGVAQAELVQAGLLANPIFEAEVKFHDGDAAFEGGVIADFLHIFQVPLRRRIAEDALEAAKLRVTGAVVDLAGDVREAFYTQQAAEQTLELRRTVTEAAEASYDFARRLHTAGNITDLELAQERALYEQSKVDLARAETSVLDGRERLNVLMGLWGEDVEWILPERLPDLPDDAPEDLDDIERRAILASLDLAAARSDVSAAARRLGIERSFGLLPELEAGVSAEKESGEDWAAGPVLELPIPLFDQGQARTAAARSELAAARRRYIATAVRVRSAARQSRNRLLAARAMADYHRQVIIPLRSEITQRTQLQYNAMQVGAFQLLAARQAEIEAGVAYINALRDYWIARNGLEQITSGRLPGFAPTGGGDASAAGHTGAARGEGGH